MQENLSIKEIAKLAGVSVATISRVMNNSGGYSAATGEKVKEIIKKYNYVPNLVAKGLRTSKTPIVGIIVPDIQNDYFSKLVFHLELALFDEGYMTTICNTNESGEREEKYVRALMAQSVSGMILISGTNYADMPEYVSVPTAYIDRRPNEGRADMVYVESDNCDGGYLATEELLNCGCKNIAFLTDVLGGSSKTGRYQGYTQALAQAGIPVNPSLILRAEDVSIESGRKAAREALSGGKIDGFVCTTDTLAAGAICGSKEINLDIPRDIKVVGFDDITLAKYFTPGITTVHQYSEKMAQITAKALVEIIGGRKPEKNSYTVPVKLMVRGSTQAAEKVLSWGRETGTNSGTPQPEYAKTHEENLL